MFERHSTLKQRVIAHNINQTTLITKQISRWFVIAEIGTVVFACAVAGAITAMAFL